jgi:hypothetical protein
MKGAVSRACGKNEACSTVRAAVRPSTACVAPWKSGPSAPVAQKYPGAGHDCQIGQKLGEGRGGNKITGENEVRPDFFCWA